MLVSDTGESATVPNSTLLGTRLRNVRGPQSGTSSSSMGSAARTRFCTKVSASFRDLAEKYKYVLLSCTANHLVGVVDAFKVSRRTKSGVMSFLFLTCL